MASRLLAFATTIHIAQALLPERFGAIVFATGVILYAGLLVDFGFEAYGPIEVSRGTTPLPKLAGTVLSFRTLLTLPAFSLLLLFTWLIPVAPFTKLILALYGLSLFTNAFDLGWTFLGGKQMWPQVVGEIIVQTTVAIGAYLLIHTPADAVLMPLLFLAGKIISVSFLFYVFSREHGMPKIGIDPPYLAGLLKSALPLCGSQVMAMISNNFDLLLIGVWLSTGAAGLYGAATRVVWVPTTICVAYYTALRPLVAHAFIEGFHTVEDMFKRSVKVTTALACGIATGGILLSQPIMTQVFGKTYASAAAPFCVLLGAFCLMLVSRNYRLVLVTFNHQATDLKIMSSAAIVNIALNVLLIKTQLGMTGAALATLASETIILVADYFCTRRLISHVPLGRYLMRPLICSAVLALYIAGSGVLSNIYLRVAIGAALYGVLMLVSRIVSVEEIKSVYQNWKPASKGAKTAPSPVTANAPNLTSVGAGSKQ